MKATAFLRKDHEKIQELAQKLRATNGNSKRTLFEDMRRELNFHSDIEHELFYPELSNSTSDQAADLVKTALNEHERIEKLLSEINFNNGGEKQAETRIQELLDLVEAHIQHEEDELFMEAFRILSEHRLEELGLEMDGRKRILMQVAA